MNKILVFICFVTTSLLAQNRLPFASQNNTIELAIVNSAPIDAGKVEVEILSPPQWVKFQNSKMQISNLKSGESSTVKFSFSVDKFAPVGKEQNLQFLITSEAGEKWTKELSIQAAAPEKFELYQNYPNPFNPTTVIEFSIPKLGNTSLKVYDAIGREVITLVNETKEPGYYSATFDASKLSSGVYIYKLSSDKFNEVKKMMVVK